MEFIDFEASVKVNVGSKDEVSDTDSLKSFVDDLNAEEENNRAFYHNFENVTRPIDEALREEFDESMCEAEQFDEVSNFCKSSEEEREVDEFKDIGKRIEKFEEMLHPIVDANNEGGQNSFVYAILYALRFDISLKVNVCTEKELQEMTGADLFLKLFKNRGKFKLELDNHKFNFIYMEINDVLTNSSYSLRVYQLTNKFRYLNLKSPTKQTIFQKFCSCENQKFNGFNIVSIEDWRKLRKKFKPIDLVYKPVRKPKEEIKCYFLRDLPKAYRNTCSKGEKLQHEFANQCCYCNNFLA